MKNKVNNSPSHSMPVTHDLAIDYLLSIIVAVLMGILSLVGVLLPAGIYPSEELILSFMVNDIVNLVIGMPFLLGSLWLTRSGRLVGLLLWPGALLYVLYNYIAYVVGIPFSLITAAYLVLVLLSGYLIFDLLRKIDSQAVQEQLSGKVAEKICGWILVGFGVLFIFRAISMFAGGSINQGTLPITEIGILIADIAVSILWTAGGVLLLRGKPLGYTSGLGLLFGASMLFVGLILLLLLQPVFTGAPLGLVDILVVFVMGLVCFIPFGLFLRGIKG
jgi:hypothetical protein